MSKQIERNRQLIALHQARKLLEEAERLLQVLPQGKGSTLNADLVDGLHAAEIIAKAVAEASKKITQKFRVSGGGGLPGHTHIMSEVSDLDLSLYALLAGRSGGQTLIGGTGSGDDLTLESTSHATKGYIWLKSHLIPTTTRTWSIGDATHLIENFRVQNSYMTSAIANLFWGKATGSGIRTRDVAGGKINFYTSYGAHSFCAKLENIALNEGEFSIQRAGDITMLTDKKVDCNTNGGELHPARVSASAQPTPSVSELQVWRDPDDNKTYIIYNDTNEGVRSVELT